jgi:hypothetical protein
MGSCEEVGLGWVESESLNDTFSCAEWLLRSGLRNAVNENLGSCLQIMGHGREVISFGMPADVADHVF